jgi:hypothetical protein
MRNVRVLLSKQVGRFPLKLYLSLFLVVQARHYILEAIGRTTVPRFITQLHSVSYLCRISVRCLPPLSSVMNGVN